MLGEFAGRVLRDLGVARRAAGGSDGGDQILLQDWENLGVERWDGEEGL